MKVNLNTVLRKLNRTDYSRSTKERYQWVITDFLSNSGGVIDQDSIDTYLSNQRSVNPNTVSALKLLANTVNMSVQFPMIERSRSETILTPKQIEELITGLPLPYSLMVGLLYSGLKTGEILNLRPQDVTDKGVVVDGTNLNVGPILDRLIVAKQYAELDPMRVYLFSPDGRNPYHSTSLSKIIKSVGTTLGLEDCNSHVIRRSFAVHAIEAGSNADALGNLMGITDMKPYVRMAKTKPRLIVRPMSKV